YMDYSSGSCQAMFTNNQKSIMHYSLTNFSFRINMVSAQNLIATGVSDNPSAAPTAYFQANKKVVCVGEGVTFYDLSCGGGVVNRQWSFQGANITGTNIENPVITYSQPGKYRVGLTVSNSLGSNSTSVEEYIEVKPSSAVDQPTARQEFESNTWNIATGWELLTSGLNSFRIDSSVSYDKKKCLVAPISSSDIDGQK